MRLRQNLTSTIGVKKTPPTKNHEPITATPTIEEMHRRWSTGKGGFMV